MTISDETAPPATDAAFGDVLREVRDTVTALLATTARAPRLVRVRAGDVAVDVHFPAAGVAAGAVAEPPPAPDAPVDAGHAITAETVGAFYHRPMPDRPPFVREGDVVQPGQQVGLIEAMKVMIPVVADRAGRVARVVAADGALVQYGDPLLVLEPADAA